MDRPDYVDRIAADARLYILKELEKQVDGNLNEISIRRVLDSIGIVRPRDWIATQLARLDGLGAVTITRHGDLIVAHLTRDGRDHLSERAVIVGITRPSEIE